MAWVKVESSVSRNRKFQVAGPAASWLWLCGLCYCQEGLTDGFIPFEALQYLGVKSASKHASVLVKAGLWETCDGGWLVHDYLAHNRPASFIKGTSDQRREAGKSGGIASGEARRAGDVKQIASTDAKQTSNPALTALTAEASDSVRTAAPRPATLVQKRRKDAAWEGPRVWVPQRTHADFIGYRGHADAERELLAWYAEVSEEWTTGAHRNTPCQANIFDFWRARYDEKWPSESGAKPKAANEWPAWGRRK